MGKIRYDISSLIAALLLLVSCQTPAELNRNDLVGTWRGKLKCLDNRATHFKLIINETGTELRARALYTDSQGRTKSTWQLYGRDFRHTGDSLSEDFYVSGYVNKRYAPAVQVGHMFVRLSSKHHLRVEGFTDCGWFRCGIHDAYGELTRQ